MRKLGRRARAVARAIVREGGLPRDLFVRQRGTRYGVYHPHRRNAVATVQARDGTGKTLMTLVRSEMVRHRYGPVFIDDEINADWLRRRKKS